MTTQENNPCAKCKNYKAHTGEHSPEFHYHCGCECHQAPIPEKKLKSLLGEHSVIDYERNHSHYHCWHQDQPPACGIPLEKHTQCCLCDTPFQEEKTTTEWEKEFEKLMPKTSGETMSYGQFCAVRNFIRQLLLQERLRMVERVEKLLAYQAFKGRGTPDPLISKEEVLALLRREEEK